MHIFSIQKINRIKRVLRTSFVILIHIIILLFAFGGYISLLPKFDWYKYICSTTETHYIYALLFAGIACTSSVIYHTKHEAYKRFCRYIATNFKPIINQIGVSDDDYWRNKYNNTDWAYGLILKYKNYFENNSGSNEVNKLIKNDVKEWSDILKDVYIFDRIIKDNMPQKLILDYPFYATALRLTLLYSLMGRLSSGTYVIIYDDVEKYAEPIYLFEKYIYWEFDKHPRYSAKIITDSFSQIEKPKFNEERLVSSILNDPPAGSLLLTLPELLPFVFNDSEKAPDIFDVPL